MSSNEHGAWLALIVAAAVLRAEQVARDAARRDLAQSKLRGAA